MGRSFLVKSEQKSAYGFFLLWRGIGEFLVRNPKYRYLYGTVSLSNIYDPRSIALMYRVLVGEKNLVTPVTDIDIQLHPEVEEYLRWHNGRFDSVPGMTGLWQVSGKNRLTFREMIQLDVRYSRQLSFGLDIKILLMTPIAIISQIMDEFQKK